VTLDPRAAAPPLLKRMVAAGLLGRKSGQGFYRYEGGRMFGG
jgi:3-hydroxybutyryl-CoA dehydrogenase